jgi:ABC-2 type transport system permease protein
VRRDAVDGVRVVMPVIGALLIAISSVVSLVAIVAVYREGGILKRLRATPLRPWTILTAHVLVKLVFTAADAARDGAGGPPLLPGDARRAGRQPGAGAAPHDAERAGVRLRHRQRGADRALRAADRDVRVLPDDRMSGLFFPIEVLPAPLETIARVLPLTPAVSLLRGIVLHDAWSAHLGDIAALALYFVAFIALSSRVFRWE